MNDQDRGGLYLYQRKHAQSMAEYNRALRINPNDANLLANSADALIYCGRIKEAVERCERAIKLNPNCPDWYWWILAHSFFHLERYEDALETVEQMTSPDQARRLSAASYAHLGRLEDARYEADEFMKIVPNFSIKDWLKTEPYSDPKDQQRYAAGLRKSGLPE